ncbi:MAG: sigma 54-interacting transcriptional regulator, partial [Myxococcales bacterium]|nr:sigma 54-interacting transcriptional regulator [Myxococcales bacterium]
DEIGALPVELQPMLLRALESGEIQPVGAARARKVDVRLIAATDAPLEAAVERGTFLLPLLHRLAGLELWVPPLRDRLDDLPRLFLAGLRRELKLLGALDRLEGDPTARKPWLDVHVISRLLAHHWPGNVRELMNMARQIAVTAHAESRVRVEQVPALQRLPRERQTLPSIAAVSSSGDSLADVSGRDASELNPDEALQALMQARWSVHAAARALGVAKTSFYRFIEAHQLMRKAGDIPDDELRAVHAACHGDREAMSDRLRVSSRALTFRLKELDPPVLDDEA